MKEAVMGILGLLAQCFAFLAGLVLSIAVGLGIAARLDGPGWLLVSTVLAGAGLLTSAVLSQIVRERLTRGGPPRVA
jgi:hypothetical protein